MPAAQRFAPGRDLTGSLGSSLTVGGEPTSNQFAPYTIQLSSDATLNDWEINWGDGTTESWAGNSSLASHTYTGTPQRYTVTATATNDNNATGVATLSVRVLPGIPQLPTFQSSDEQNISGRWLSQDSQQSQQETGDVTISGEAAPMKARPYLLNLRAEDSSGNTITGWQINWGDGGQPQSISSAPASVTHDYGAVGRYAISATATVSDGQGGTYTAVTGGQAGALDSSFGTDGIAQVDGNNYGTGNSVAIDPNGDLVVAPPGELMFYTADGVPDAGLPVVDTGLYSPWGCKTAVQPDGKVVIGGGGYGSATLARLNSNGTLDTTFGGTGVVTTDLGTYFQVVLD